MATVLISGGTGMIGTALAEALLKKGDEVIILTRGEKKQEKPGIAFAKWDIKKQYIDEEAIKKADHLIHLAGANLAVSRWTVRRKKEIVDSRVSSGQLLARAVQEIPNKIKTVISSSAIGFYGADPKIPNPKPFVETDRPASDFLGSLVQDWEAAIQPVKRWEKRLVVFRTGIVLSKKGGALPEFEKPMRFGIATILGNGKQIISWIHIEDLVRLYLEAIENPDWQGIYNAVAPGKVSNKELIAGIAAQRNKFSVRVHVPAILLKIVLGEMSIEVLKSATVSSSKLEELGFRFLFPTIAAAIRDLGN